MQKLKHPSAEARRPTATRAALLAAFERLLQRDELAACTSTAIAAEAGFSAGTFYGYFRDRNDALAALFADRLDVIMTSVSDALVAESLLDHGLEATLDAAVVATIDGYRRHAAVLRAALSIVQSDPTIRAVYWDRHAGSIDGLLQFLRRGAAAGMIRPDRHRSLAHTVLLLIQSLNSPVVLSDANRRLVAGVRRDVTTCLVRLLEVWPPS